MTGQNMLETWKPVVGYEGLYEVSDQGRIRSLPRAVVRSDGRTMRLKGKVLACAPNNTGYRTVILNKAGTRPKSTFVHRVVLETFEGPPPEGKTQVLHGPGGKLDNSPGNLRWGTPLENEQDKRKFGFQYWRERTHCKHGHEYTPENTIRYGNNPARVCRACIRERSRRAYAKIKALRERSSE